MSRQVTVGGDPMGIAKIEIAVRGSSTSTNGWTGTTTAGAAPRIVDPGQGIGPRPSGTTMAVI